MTLQDEVTRLEARVLAAWSRGAAFRSRYSPDPSSYWTVKHQALARACQAVARLGVTPWGNGDLGTAVVEQLAAAGDLAKHWAIGDTPLAQETLFDPDKDLGRLRELWALLRLKNDLGGLVTGIDQKSDLAAVRSRIVETLSQATVGTPLLAYSQYDGLARVLVESAAERSVGAKSGIPTLDRLVGGIRPGHVWVVGAPTNWGKTSFAVAVADRHQGKTLIISCEDAPELVFGRLLARRAKVNGLALRDGKLNRDERLSVEEAVLEAKAHGTTPFVLDGRGHSVERLADFMRIAIRVHGISLVICDYLQCIATERKTDDRRHEINHIARTLTDAIKSNGAAGIITSQLTDENIRDSRDVEHAAEVVLIGRKQDGAMSLYLKKSKTGPADVSLKVHLNRETGALDEQVDEWDDYVPSGSEEWTP